MNDTYAFIEAEKTTHGVAFLCRLLKVARSSFYAWLAAARTRSVRKAADEALVHEITVIHVGSRQTYGVPRIHAELRRLGRREPQAGRPPDARARYSGSPSPQAAVADPAG
ncbi:IS3 family transposase [Streptomyces aureus]